MNVVKVWLIFLFISISALKANSQSGITTIGGRSIGLANSTATLKDEWSLLNNVGGISNTKEVLLATAYETSPALAGANRMAALFMLPTKFGASGIGVFKFGDNLYSEQVLTVGYGNELGNTSLGIKINYVQYRATGFETRSAISINFGGITQLSSKVTLGAYITNLNQPKLSSIDNEKLPTSLVVGISFKPIESLLMVSEIDKDLSYSPTIKGALEYTVYKKIVARTGFTFQPEAAFFGLGFIHANLKIDYGLKYSQNLNYAFQASIIYRLRKAQKKSNA